MLNNTPKTNNLRKESKISQTNIKHDNVYKNCYEA